jgi:hypothetical protein
MRRHGAASQVAAATSFRRTLLRRQSPEHVIIGCVELVGEKVDRGLPIGDPDDVAPGTRFRPLTQRVQ